MNVSDYRVCGDIDPFEPVTLCECGSLRQANRPCNYTRETLPPDAPDTEVQACPPTLR